MPQRRSNQLSGRIQVRLNLPELPADKFYAGIKKKRGPMRKPLAEVLQRPKKEV